MSKLTWHFQGRPKDILDIAKESKAQWLKFIDPPVDNPAPGKNIIGRYYMPDGEANAMIMQGKEGALVWFNKNQYAFTQAPYVHCWELPNEPPVETKNQRAKLVEFSLRAIELMHTAGLRTVALNLSVGWPSIGTAIDLIPILRETDFWGLHEYGWRTMDSDAKWYSLRHRRTVDEMGTEVPPLLITECGLEPGGWKKFTNREGFQEQLAWWDDELEKDEYVYCATLFTSGPNSDWEDFDIDKELSLWLKDRIAQSPPIPPVLSTNISNRIREEAWDWWGISYNPEAAFSIKARELNLGVPMTDEFDLDGYRAQGYAGGIVYCKIGHWNDIEFVSW